LQLVLSEDMFSNQFSVYHYACYMCNLQHYLHGVMKLYVPTLISFPVARHGFLYTFYYLMDFTCEASRCRCALLATVGLHFYVTLTSRNTSCVSVTVALTATIHNSSSVSQLQSSWFYSGLSHFIHETCFDIWMFVFWAVMLVDLQAWRWRQYIPPKHCTYLRLYPGGPISSQMRESQKSVFWYNSQHM
jgi:hypothetical protein